MDEIRLEGMTFYGYHGVLAAERQLGQRFTVDVIMETSLGQAGRSDELADTIDYTAAYAVARETVEGEPYRLIETVAERIAERLLHLDTRIQRVRVTVSKPGAPIVGATTVNVSVVVDRERATG